MHTVQLSYMEKSYLGNEKVVELLIENGANIAALNDEKETPLHWAAFNRKRLLLLRKNCIDKTTHPIFR